MYILENYEKVKDWSELDIKLNHGLNGTQVEFYNHYKKPIPPKEPTEKMKNFMKLVSKEKTKSSEIWDKWKEEMKAKHNPIVSFDKAVLDTSDGDFSVVINGQDFYWIGDWSIIQIADYIEEQLKTDC
jgi:hypothetical protein